MADSRTRTEDVALPEPRLIPHVVSKQARDTPNKTWGSLPKHASDASQGYEDITFARLNYAITRAVWWMQESIEPQRLRPHEALAYLGPPDSRYVVLAIAAIKAGFQMLFLSPRNSDKAQCSVIKEANCQKFVCSSSMESRVRKLLRDQPQLESMNHFVVPEQETLLKDEVIPDIPYKRTVEQARTEPLVILHTSSTTGIPKTIPLLQGYGLHEDVVQHVLEFNGLDIITRKPFYGHCRMFVAMPLFHAGGVLLTLLKSLYHDIVSVFQPPSAALNAEVFDGILRHGNCNGCVIPPYLLEEMLAEPKFFDTLASLKFVQFGSGPLSHAAGDLLLTRQTNCPHFIGSSECGLYILLELDDPVADWRYFRFHPWSGVDMRPIDDQGGTYEMFIVRSNAPKVPGMQPVFELFPQLNEWPTKDMYVQHPTKPDHWRYIGRNDDVLVLSNGEKINPVDTESRITNAHPSITGALVIAQGQFAPGLLLETRGTEMIDLSTLWPIIQAANADAPGHGKLNRSLVLFASPDKPFLRTPKLSVRRQPTIDLYSSEIEEMYNRYQNEIDEAAEAVEPSFDLTSLSGAEGFVLSTIESVTEWDVAPTFNDDLFMHGMDSLQVARLARAIKTGLAGSSRHHEASKQISARMIYSHPTAGALATAIFKLVGEVRKGVNAVTLNGHLSREEMIEQMIAKYSQFDLPLKGRRAPNSESPQTRRNVLLTGSTGSLGGYIVQSLLTNPRVEAIYCLNRSREAKSKSIESLREQGVDGLTFEKLDKRVHFLHTTALNEPQLGLSDPKAFELLQRRRITHIIHNAWPVNFNLSLPSFESHIAGVRALIDFAASVPERPEIILVSSLSSVTALSGRITVPESISLDALSPAHMGYGESKYVAERVLSNATRASQGELRTSVLRVGQIAGPVKSGNGIWPTREWLPSLVISSKTIGALPKSLGRMSFINWLPVDLLADSIVELLETTDTGRKLDDTDIYHVVNSNEITWSDILPTFMEQTNVKRTVPLQQWIELVNSGPDESSTTHPNPARKILGYYEALEPQQQSEISQQSEGVKVSGEVNGEEKNERARFEVDKLAACSKTFRDMGPVKEEWVRMWTSKWV